MNRSFNLAAFPVGWAACLWGAANGHPFVGPLVVGVLLAAQSFTMIDARRTVGLIAVVAILGTGIDSTLLDKGLYWAKQPLHGEWLCPLWITAIWINLGTALHGCLAGLGTRYTFVALLGTSVAPAAFLLVTAPGWTMLILAVILFTLIWVILSTALHCCLSGIGRRYALTAMLGATIAPEAYLLAEAVGAIQIIVAPWPTLSTFALMGAIVGPGLLWLSRLGVYRPRSTNNACGDG